MAQRPKQCYNSLNLDAFNCEAHTGKLLKKEKSVYPASKPTLTSTICFHKCKEKVGLANKQTPSTISQLSKVRPNVKQQNMPSPNSTTNHVMQYSTFDDVEAPEVTEKPVIAPRQRSRSTVATREPWGQLLKQQKSSENVSLFSNFDPLRTLHFLAKELQFHLQTILPDDSSIQQMVSDMQYALKRVPPEVASTVHLQQALNLLPSKRQNIKSLHEKPEKLKPTLHDKVVQTLPIEEAEIRKLQEIMEENTVKLESSYRHLENVCTKLKNEKESLEKQLIIERDGILFLKKRIEDLEYENKEQLSSKIDKLKQNNAELELEVTQLKSKLKYEAECAKEEIKSTLIDLKNSKSAVEQECLKLKHQIRLCSIEKEKYLSILAVRDRQINEIRTEMSQLQEVVNDQLVELHNDAVASMPSSSTIPIWKVESTDGKIEDGRTISSVHTNEDRCYEMEENKRNNSFKDLHFGDNEELETLTRQENAFSEKVDMYFSKAVPYKKNKEETTPEALGSQTVLRNMFSEIKRQAYALTSHRK